MYPVYIGFSHKIKELLRFLSLVVNYIAKQMSKFEHKSFTEQVEDVLKVGKGIYMTFVALGWV